MKKFLNYFLVLLVGTGTIQSQAKLSKKNTAIVVTSATVAGIVLGAVLASRFGGFNKYVQIIRNNKALPESYKETLTNQKSYKTLKAGIETTNSLDAKSVNQVEYDTALQNKKWIFENGKTPRLSRGISAEELSKAVENYVKSGANKAEVISDLKTDSVNFINKDGKPTITLEEWKQILRDNLNITNESQLDNFANDLIKDWESFAKKGLKLNQNQINEIKQEWNPVDTTELAFTENPLITTLVPTETTTQIEGPQINEFEPGSAVETSAQTTVEPYQPGLIEY